MAATGGAETHTLTVDEMPAHTHSTAADSSIDRAGGGGTCAEYNASAVTGSTGGDAAHNNMQPFLVMNYIIKT